MRILVLNGGSSSIKFSMFTRPFDSSGDTDPKLEFDGQLSGIGGDEALLIVAGKGSSVHAGTLAEAVALVLDSLARSEVAAVDAVGYRVVHPGARLRGHQRITREVLTQLVQASDFAPLHDPEAVLLIRATMQRHPRALHYACFDTVFHESLPEPARIYPLPQRYRESGVHRFGFHGLSCESIVRQMRLTGMLPRRMAIAHLGSGCSVTALQDGLSVDTTMGLTPTGGVLMGTRSGDLDPGLVLYLLRQETGDREQAVTAVETLLNHLSGISSLSGLPNDMRQLRAAAEAGDGAARLALDVFTRSITKALGAFCWLLGGLDALVFTGGIGEHDAATRREVLAGLAEMGVELAPEAESANSGELHSISVASSRTQVYVAPAQEDLMIALHVHHMMEAEGPLHQRSQPRHQEETQ